MSLHESFWTHVDKSGECWEWTGSKSPDGYGRAATYRTHGTSLPHRAVWIDINGPIAEGLTLDHICNNRACVNPGHLEPVTHAENVRRAKDRRTHCPNGHPLDFQTSDYNGGTRCLLCRRKANREATERWRRTHRAEINAYARKYRARKNAEAVAS